MGILNLSNFCDVVVADTATAAGTTDTILSDAVNVQGADSVLCLVELGVVTSSGTVDVTITESATSGGQYTTITGATTGLLADKSNLVVQLEVIRPKKGFIKISCARATANVIIKSMLAIVQRNGSRPINPTSEANTPVIVVG